MRIVIKVKQREARAECSSSAPRLHTGPSERAAPLESPALSHTHLYSQHVIPLFVRQPYLIIQQY